MSTIYIYIYIVWPPQHVRSREYESQIGPGARAQGGPEDRSEHDQLRPILQTEGSTYGAVNTTRRHLNHGSGRTSTSDAAHADDSDK